MNQTAINLTQKWLTEAVIKYQFCPYAQKPHERDIIGYRVYSGAEMTTLLEDLAYHCMELDNCVSGHHTQSLPSNTKVLETTLVIIANHLGEVAYLSNFYDYLDALAIANDFLATPRNFINALSDAFIEKHSEKLPESWAEKYQLAGFHPNYQFEGTTIDEIENYTNRSPYPLFHIIRNESIEAVRMNDAHAQKIVAQNIATIKSLSDDALLLLRNLSTH